MTIIKNKDTNTLGDVIKNENELWSHASSIEPDKRKVDQMLELAFMKELFAKHLPTGQNKEVIDNYFNGLEQVIFTKDHVEIPRDEFPRDDDESETGSASDSSDTSSKRVYKYFSADLFKQQALQRSNQCHNSTNQCDRFIGYDDQRIEEIYDSSDSTSSFGSSQIQDEFGGSGYLPRLQECEDGIDSEISS